MSCVLSETPTPFALLAPMETGLSPERRMTGTDAVIMEGNEVAEKATA